MTMDNQTKEEVTTETEVKTETTQETEVKVVSPTEEAARASGWVPKDEWVASGKSVDDWRTAREYQERGELFDEIHRLKEDQKQTGKAFKVLVEHHRKVRETAVKEALEQLKAEKRQAMLNNDVERVVALDDEIDKVRDTPIDVPKIDIKEEPPGPTPAFKQWHKYNSWYQIKGSDDVSRWADVIGAKYKEENPDATEQELLDHVEKKVARRFPDSFENPKSKGTSEVNPKTQTKTDAEVFKLTAQEEAACKLFVDQGVMSRKEYVEELKKLGRA